MVRPTQSSSQTIYRTPYSKSACAGIAKYNTEPQHFQVGGTARLFIGNEKVSNNLVAIKVIDVKDRVLLEAYENEVSILKTTKHSRYIAQLKDHFVYQGLGYIVMDLLSQDLYARSESFETIDEVKYIFRQICEGVAELHRLQIAHLDLKPENILLDDYDNVKICDFGSSFQWNNEPNCTAFVGSDFYLAPEVFAHHHGYDASQADIWSLGVMLHMMLTDSFPFEGKTQKEMLGNYFTSKVSFTEVKMVCPDDKSVHSLLAKMLNKNPSARPSINEVLEHEWFGSNEIELCLK